MRIVKSLIVIGIFLIFISPVFSQSGMRFPEFSNKLEYYFGSELIADIEKELPQGTNYTIWSWDVGDFSGDGNYDLAFVTRLASEKKRIVQVNLFVDMDGFLKPIAKYDYEFVDMPLEVGIIVRHNACFITKKFKQYNWSIEGFRFADGNLVTLDNYTTEQFGKFTGESYQNFQDLKCTETLFLTNKKSDNYYSKYLSIPCYPRSRFIYKGYTEYANVEDVDFVNKGAWYWSGTEDASFSIKPAYDNEYLYLILKITDDYFIQQYCDTCIGDHIRLWFDFSRAGLQKSRFPYIHRNKVLYEDIKEEEVYSLEIFPGDFIDKSAYVSEVSASKKLADYQELAVKNIRAAAVPRENGYEIKVKIPFRLFGYESAPVNADKFFKISFTAVFHDIDNEFRPEEETTIATSIFTPSKLDSYGELVIIPNDEWYGKAKNYYKKDILRYLMELGF